MMIFSAQSFIYLLTVWICGALFSALIMYILLLQLQDKPHYFGKGSHIGGIPSVVYEPNPNRFDVSTKGVISFSSREPKSYLNYMVRYKKLLKGEMHHVSLYLYTAKCKVLHPSELYLMKFMAPLVHVSVRTVSLIQQGSAVTRMLPASGMSTCAYPFWNQPGYEQPFVMMKVSNLMTDMNEIRCKPEQASIQHFDDGEENVARIFIEKLD
ncbi:unnamed protein product [Nippostrongylus brasiliensis]|uniref:Uncharacterized protein n=1 Tax=Nippostrongylus brasiliensis TaxID=27835 RepID=A0A0N4XD37_NIPBR|nr:unnamed protein product [Nippostrongylus brasiliensis]